jgi:hypothetical protein
MNSAALFVLAVLLKALFITIEDLSDQSLLRVYESSHNKSPRMFVLHTTAFEQARKPA